MKTVRALLAALVLASMPVIVACGGDDDVEEQIRGPHSIQVTILGTGTGTVTHVLSPDLPCKTADSPCIWDFSEDQIMTTTLEAVPDEGSEFAGWEDACTADPCTITVDGQYDVTATFNLI